MARQRQRFPISGFFGGGTAEEIQIQGYKEKAVCPQRSILHAPTNLKVSANGTSHFFENPVAAVHWLNREEQHLAQHPP